MAWNWVVANGHLFERLLTECPALQRLIGVDLGHHPERRARVRSVEARFPGRARMLWCSTEARWRTKVRPGGWFGGHDYCAQFPGVIQAVDEAFGGRVGQLPDTIWFVRDEI